LSQIAANNLVIKYSIIIPVKSINKYVTQTVSEIDRIDRSDLEVIILTNSDEDVPICSKKITIIPTGRVGPAEKRDLGATQSSGTILVFLDDDSYPQINFLDYADRFFQEEGIVAIGGPGITPPNASFSERISGAVFLSKFTGGAPERYISYGSIREVDDWPSVNLMVRKKEFIEIGGFDTQYWPGEDSKLCLDLITLTQKKILYIPEMIVWHHRRSSLYQHLKQIGGYGLHRGYFAKRRKKNSLKAKYFIPSTFVFLLLGSWALSMANIDLATYLLLSVLAMYQVVLILGYMDLRKYESRSVSLAAMLYVILTHVVYGLSFANGFFKNKLVSKLR